MSQEERKELLDAVNRFYEKTVFKKAFIPGKTFLPAAGKVVGIEELQFLIEASCDLWLTTGPFADRFEKEFSLWMGRRFCLLCNSGSSANLLALMALTSPLLKDKALKHGDEVITVAAGFPTTVTPILQASLVPVYVDIKRDSLNVDVDILEKAIGPKTKAIMLAHTLGNPFDLDRITKLVKDNDLWLIEDNCDATGSLWHGKKTGTFGHLSTFSFYPAHHMTTGEGGAVTTDDPLLKRIVESFRDWGRDCYCPPGRDNTCGRRFDCQMGDLPYGYDHKYIYRHLGYNLKSTDFAAAIGLAQLSKLDSFIEKRRLNFDRLKNGLLSSSGRLKLPSATEGANPSWFGFPIAVEEDAGFKREELTGYLESHAVGTRLLFGGNITKQPAFQGTAHRLISSLTETDWAMYNIFWIGVWPGLNDDMIDYMIDIINKFIKNN
jgi:CDP-6-deoxy-D-xylo-4-hexulose-3-dehydrase